MNWYNNRIALVETMTGHTFHRSRAEMLAERPAPITSVGVIGWMRANLFSNYFSVALTLVAARHCSR